MGITYGRQINSFDIQTGIELGIVRTFFQSNFFPKFKVGSAYYILNKDRFRLGPLIQYSFSYLRYSNLPKGNVLYHELSTGLRWKYGKKWQIGQTLLIGGLWENSYNTIYQKRKFYGTLGYTLQIDCTYAF